MTFHQKSFAALFLLLLLFVSFYIDHNKKNERGLIRTVKSLHDQTSKYLYKFHDQHVHFLNWELRTDSPMTRSIQIEWDANLWFEPDVTHQFMLVSDAEATLKIDGITLASHSSYKAISKTQFSYKSDQSKNTLNISYTDEDEISHLSLLWENKHGEFVPIPSRYFSLPDSQEIDVTKRIMEDWVSYIIPFLFILFVTTLLLILAEYYDCLSETSKARVAVISVATLGIVGGIIRFSIANLSGWNFQADEAVVGIMAQRIAKLQEFPLVYLGQSYGGPLLSYVMAPLMTFEAWIPFLIRGVPAVLSALVAFGVYWVAQRYFGFKAALTAMLFWVISPVMIMVYGLMCMVGPIEIILLMIPVMLWAKTALTETEHPQMGLTVLSGVCSGLALWGNLQALFVLLPLWGELLFQSIKQKRFSRHVPYCAGLMVGAIPMIMYNVINRMATIHYFLFKNSSEWMFDTHVIKAFFYEALPEFLGQSVRWYPWEFELPNTYSYNISLWPSVYGPSILFCAVMVTVGLASFSIVKLHSSRQTVLLRYLFFVVCLSIFLFCFSSVPDKSSRHLMLVYPPYIILLGWFICHLYTRHKTVACFVLAASLCWNLHGYLQTNPNHYFQPYHYLFWGKSIPKNLDETASALLKDDIDGIYVDYWVGENLSYAMREVIPVFSNPPRRVDDAIKVLAAKQAAYIYHTNEHNLNVYLMVMNSLGFVEKQLFPFVVYTPGEKKIMPKSDIQVVVQNPINKFHLYDGNLYTWWSPDTSDNHVRFEFNAPKDLEEIIILCQLEDSYSITALTLNNHESMFPISQEMMQTTLTYNIIHLQINQEKVNNVEFDIDLTSSSKIFDVLFVEQ